MDLFWFICYPRGDRSKIEVVDLNYDCAYEKSEFALVNNLEFHDVEEAIDYARSY